MALLPDKLLMDNKKAKALFALAGILYKWTMIDSRKYSMMFKKEFFSRVSARLKKD
ncbi:MAG: hypothetical protein WC296_03985 [Candidatus Izemoplasmatales bacterium]|jgi:hypothetical protein